MADEKMVKVHVLQNAGPYKAGSVVELKESEAKVLADGVKGMTEEAFAKKQSEDKDVSKMTVAQMQEKGLKNVVGDLGVLAQIEKAALEGKPVASSEPMTVTGGVTPPSLVHPAFAKAGGHDYTDAKEVKGVRVKKDGEVIKEEKK